MLLNSVQSSLNYVIGLGSHCLRSVLICSRLPGCSPHLKISGNATDSRTRGCFQHPCAVYWCAVILCNCAQQTDSIFGFTTDKWDRTPPPPQSKSWLCQCMLASDANYRFCLSGSFSKVNAGSCRRRCICKHFGIAEAMHFYRLDVIPVTDWRCSKHYWQFINIADRFIGSRIRNIYTACVLLFMWCMEKSTKIDCIWRCA